MLILFAGGQINPNGSESINLQIVEKLTVGQDQAWVRLPDLQKRRQVNNRDEGKR